METYQRHEVAVSKWEMDRDHIENYKVDLKRKVGDKSFRR